MDHSIKGYLQRRSEEELRAILMFCEEQEDEEYYGGIMEYIKELLGSKEGGSQRL